MPIVTLGGARADTGSSSPALMPLHMSAEGLLGSLERGLGPYLLGEGGTPLGMEKHDE